MSSGDTKDAYFQSYEDLEVHKLMLDDKPRTLAYKNAIFACRKEFENKIVMDVGSGTGILSVFCAQAGAAKVFAVEASHMAKIAEKVVAENNFGNVIEVIQSRVEDLKIEDIGKVDVIVSEWMGFYLLHEGMLDSVITARDHFLKDNGLLFPNEATIYAVPCELPSLYAYWDEVYGVSMKCIGEEQRRLRSSKPDVLSLDRKNLLADSKRIVWLDLNTVTREELNIVEGDDTVAVCERKGRYQGVCVWFSVGFPNNMELSTSPEDELTHWKHTVVVFPEDTEVEKGEPLAFKLKLNRDPLNDRTYNMELTKLNPEEVEHDIPCSCHMTMCIVTKAHLQSLDAMDQAV